MVLSIITTTELDPDGVVHAAAQLVGMMIYEAVDIARDMTTEECMDLLTDARPDAAALGIHYGWLGGTCFVVATSPEDLVVTP